ncbi:urease accessory protein UreD [Corallococcus sp. BB11-1]|uniref:urease accessory protein UreD n=1 Tax=Corallococcus sp. BB11-1 TaxID=2996783 RepID=UPI002D1E3DCD|nr:urease accessory protein UreD [Corallococcus sp. BB11-1]
MVRTALLATQGANRVYRSPHGCRGDLFARVGPDVLFAWVPDPTVCFTGARYSQAVPLRASGHDTGGPGVRGLRPWRSLGGRRGTVPGDRPLGR